MDTGLRVNIDLFCSQVVILLYIGLQSNTDRKKLDYRLFLIMLILVCMELLADSAKMLTDGSATLLGQIILHISTFVLFAINPFITMMYAIYVELLTFKFNRRKRYHLLLFYFPALFILCLCITSLYNNWLFSFNSLGYFQRGRFAIISMIVFYSYLLCGLFIVYVRRKAINPIEYQGLVTFPIPMVACGILQLFLPDYVILLPSMALSLIILNKIIQERRLMVDHLTGVYNRRKLDEYLKAILENSRITGKTFGAFLADVNNFKYINDTFGHITGDKALITIAKILQKSVRFDDFVARYAGDEFVVILPCTNQDGLNKIIDRVQSNFQLHSEKNDDYSLSISIGGSEFKSSYHGSEEDLIKYLDLLMYDQKKHKTEKSLLI